MRTPLQYYGGKTRMLPHILPLIPEHRIYVEGFAGGAAVFFAKAPSVIEVLNDTNGCIANFYRVCADPVFFSRLLKRVEGTLSDERTHRIAKDIYFGSLPSEMTEIQVDKAWAVWVLANMSFGGQLGAKFQTVCNYSDNWSPGVKIKNRRRQFKYYAGRLEKVTVLDRDAVEIIKQYDAEDTFFYLDPPYVGARQGHYEGYKQEDFDLLLYTLSQIKGKFLLSSYTNDALTRFCDSESWNTMEIRQRAGVSSMQREKTEVLTWNYEQPMPQIGKQQALEL